VSGAADLPFVVTERLELWQPRLEDVWSMHAIVTHAQTRRHLGRVDDRAEHYTRFQRGAGSWLLSGYGSLMVRLRGGSELIGNCGVFHSYRGMGDDFDDQPEAGWIIAHEHAGKGYASEAMAAVLAWFDAAHGPRRIICMIEPDNAASLALAAKLGFAVYRQAELPDGAAILLLERRA
jgi:RimJ/RimL family protein N-acetyltransferase